MFASHDSYSKETEFSDTIRYEAKVSLTNGSGVITYIPDKGHNLQEQSVAFVLGRHVKALSGVRYHFVSGAFYCFVIYKLRRSSSKYSVKCHKLRVLYAKKKKVVKHVVEKEPRYGNPLISQLVSVVMQRGKKN